MECIFLGQMQYLCGDIILRDTLNANVTYFTCHDLRFTNWKENGNWSDYFKMIFSEMLMPNYYCDEGFKYIITDDHKQWFAFPSFVEMSPKIDEVSWSFYNNYSGSLHCNCTAQLPASSGHTITKLYTEKLIVFSQSSALIAKRSLLLGRPQTLGINSRTFRGVGFASCSVYVHPRYEFVTKFSFQRDCGESIGLKAGSEKRLIVVFSQVSPLILLPWDTIVLLILHFLCLVELSDTDILTF